MSAIVAQFTYVGPADATTSRITDIVLGSGDQSGLVYTTTRFDGTISSFDARGTGLVLRDADGFASNATAGSVPHLALLDTDNGPHLLSGGGTGQALTLRDLNSVGGLGVVDTLGGDSVYGTPLIAPTAVARGDGTTGIYAGLANGSGVAWMVVSAGGTITDHGTAADFGSTHARDVTDVAHARIGTSDFVFTTSATDLGVTSWQIATDGSLRARASLTPSDGLWISGASALETVTIAGQTYLILGAAGSGSLSVISVGPLGGLTLTDHVLDDRNSRFDGVTDITSVTHNGQVWIFAGGSDDGISAFILLPDGKLVARAHIADTPDITLANISALAARSDGNMITLFAASSVDAGLTRLALETGPAGVTLTGGTTAGALTGTSGADVLLGGAGDETLTGGAGDDVIRDGAGSDTLTGGAGADLFLLDADDAFDVITDFTVGEDRIDLGAWPGLRSVNQLFMIPTSDGIQISYGAEVLVIRSADGAPIAPGDLSEADLLGPVRIPDEILTGFAGPVTPVPDLPDRPEPPPARPDPADLPIRQEVVGTSGIDTLFGDIGDDLLFGQGGNDRLLAGTGADLLFGGAGNDMLDGSGGDDMLYGGEGRDTAWMTPATPAGSHNADRLIGGPGDDTLYGQAGDDTLDGGSGDDVLVGGGGRDTFVFRSGTDTVADFTDVTDRIALDDVLWDGTLNTDALVARYATDTGADIVLDFGRGNSLRLEDYDDLDALAARIDIV